MNQNTTGNLRTRSVWAAILAVIVVIAALLVWGSFRSAKSMSTAASSDEDVFIHATPGDIVKVVLEIENSSTEGSIRGKLLRKETEKIYRRTNTQVTAQSGPQTKLVMGKQSEIHPAAVVHVTGMLKKDHRVDASQIVILTGYVEIK
jgi:hypothetical protein